MLENKSNTEEDRVAIVEQQLAQAKLIAEEADKKYEEVKLQLKKTTQKSSSLFCIHKILFCCSAHFNQISLWSYCTFYS